MITVMLVTSNKCLWMYSLMDLPKKLLSIQSDIHTSDAIKRNLVQQHEQSLYSLKELGIDKRIHSGVTLAFSEADLEKAKIMIKNFNREFISQMGKSREKDSIYQINVFFYPLTKEIEKIEES